MKLKRLNRMQYWMTMLVACVFLVVYLSVVITADVRGVPEFLLALPLIIFIIVYFGAILLRLADIGKRPYYLALCFIFPVYIIMIGFTPSKEVIGE